MIYLKQSDRLDPNETDTFTWDWGNLTPGTITAFVVSVASGTATVNGSAIVGTLTTASISGAVAPQVSILGRITTASGRILDETIVIPVGDQ